MDSPNSISQFDHLPDQFEHPYEYYKLNTGRSINRLVPEKCEVVLNTNSGLVLLINWEEHRILAETEVNGAVLPILKKLLDDWPSYVEYDRLIRILFAQNETLATQFILCIEDARETQNSTLLDVALQPLRDVLIDCKTEMRWLGIDVTAVIGYGYRLIPLEAKNQPLL
jgi:hypothetical protein